MTSLRHRCCTLACLMPLWSCVLACHSEPAIESKRTPGLSQDEIARLPQAPPKEPEAPPPPPPPAFKSSIGLKRPDDPNRKPAGTTVDPSAAKPEEDKPERQLGDELKAALGQPIDCLDLQKVVDGGGKLKVRVTAYVGPSGRITRASVSAPGQPASTSSCIENRTIAIKMAEPIEDAPRAVETELSFEIARAKP